MKKEKEKYAVCSYTDACCFRDRKKRCRVLNDTKFDDGKCHFRKLTRSGPNEYDLERGKIKVE